MLILDTKGIAPDDRGDAYQAAVSANCTTSAATFESPNIWAKIHAYDLGVAKVLTIDASGTTLRRTQRMARAMNDCPIALALPMRTRNRLTWSREDQVFDKDDLMLVELSAPYLYSWGGNGASYAFHVEYDDLDIPMDTIRSATANLRRSPIYTLVRDHIAHVMTAAADIVDSGAAHDVGAGSAELMRALIVSAASDEMRARDVMHATTAERVQAYVRHHLRDPDLTPAKIAAANAVSLRELYRLYERLGISLERSIIEQRLRGVRDELSSPRARHLSIAAISQAWGFSNAGHFATRFRLEFGMTPRQWREQSQTRAPVNSPQSEPAVASV